MARTQRKKSKGNGQGTIFYNKSKKIWVAQYTVNGKRKTIYQKKHESKKKFVAKFTKIMNDLNQGTYIDKVDKTFKEIAEEYVKDKYKTNKVTARTYTRDMQTVKEIEKTCPEIFNMPIQQITVYHIRNALPNITCYSNRSIDKIYRLINKVFKIAISDRIILFNPLDNESISKPKSDIPDTQVEALTLEENKKLIQILDSEEVKDNKYRNIVLLQLYTGIRIGEALAITLDDIDFKKRNNHHQQDPYTRRKQQANNWNEDKNRCRNKNNFNEKSNKKHSERGNQAAKEELAKSGRQDQQPR